MKKYTVILIYPDYIATRYGEEFYTARVLAKDPEDALREARRQAVVANGGSLNPLLGNYIHPVDFASAAVFEGFHDNVSPE